MAYDVLAESVELIEHGVTSDPHRLSRRRRFAAMAVDVDGDVACTMFARRGVGTSWRETHLLQRRGGTWTLLGGGGGSGHEGELADRPSARLLGNHVVVRGGAAVSDAERRSPRGAGWVSSAELLTSREAQAILVGPRTLPVPRHGHLVVVWSSRQPPSIVAVDESGRRLVQLRLPAAR